MLLVSVRRFSRLCGMLGLLSFCTLFGCRTGSTSAKLAASAMPSKTSSSSAPQKAPNVAPVMPTGNPPAATPVPVPTATPTPTPTPIAAPVLPATAVAFPALQFIDNPGGDDNKAVALTFDDGPDGTLGNTNYILDQLKSLDLKATFFICGNLWSDLLNDPNAQANIRRIVAEGHTLGNHTVHHYCNTGDANVNVASELATNQAILANPNVLGSQAPMMTMYRMPCGVPYQENTSVVNQVAPITANYGVHVGWALDTNDWACAENGQTTQCILNNLKTELQQGHSGVILMHAVWKLTGDALPSVVALIKAQGYHIVSVESLIISKYGVDSAALAEAHQNAQDSNATIVAAAVKECSENIYNEGESAE